MQQNKLYVGNLPYTIDESGLKELFSSYGDVDDIKLIRDWDTGRSKGFAFITFSTQHAAEKALEQNEKEIDGKTIKVNIAKEKSGRGHRGGGNRGSRW
ncbi:MAG: RNA recognition motif domain-containing protein [bacterium]